MSCVLVVIGDNMNVSQVVQERLFGPLDINCNAPGVEGFVAFFETL